MGSRHVRHPEAVALERAGLAPPSTLPRKGWQPDYGWVVIFYTADGFHTHHHPPGSDLELVREETRLTLRSNSKYTKAWIKQKDGRNQ